MRKCSVLYVNACRAKTTETRALRALGFRVDEVPDIPPQDTTTTYHVVIIHACAAAFLAAVATRLRARPGFGRRVLVALVCASVSARARREAIHSGFDLILPEDVEAAALRTSMMSTLRKYPEFECLLPDAPSRRRAAVRRRRAA